MGIYRCNSFCRVIAKDALAKHCLTCYLLYRVRSFDMTVSKSNAQTKIKALRTQ